MATNEQDLGGLDLETPVAAETSSTTLSAGSTETGLSRTQRAKQGLKNAAKDKKKVAIASAAAVAVAGAAAGLLTRSRRKSSAAAGEGDGSPGLYASPEISTGTGVEDRTLKAAEKARKKEEKEKKNATGKESKKSKSH
jgi:hypothetical protein